MGVVAEECVFRNVCRRGGSAVDTIRLRIEKKKVWNSFLK